MLPSHDFACECFRIMYIHENPRLLFLRHKSRCEFFSTHHDDESSSLLAIRDEMQQKYFPLAIKFSKLYATYLQTWVVYNLCILYVLSQDVGQENFLRNIMTHVHGTLNKLAEGEEGEDTGEQKLFFIFFSLEVFHIHHRASTYEKGSKRRENLGSFAGTFCWCLYIPVHSHRKVTISHSAHESCDMRLHNVYYIRHLLSIQEILSRIYYVRVVYVKRTQGKRL